MKKLIAAAVVLGSLTGGGYAQQKDDDPIALEQQQKKLEAEAVDKRYKATLDKTRQNTTPTRADPWSNMRGADDSKTKR